MTGAADMGGPWGVVKADKAGPEGAGDGGTEEARSACQKLTDGCKCSASQPSLQSYSLYSATKMPTTSSVGV